MKNKLLLILGICWCTVSLVAQTMPRVYISYDVLDRDTFNTGSFTLIDDQDTLTTPMLVRHRGSSSAHFSKQAYAVKLRDSIGGKVETSLLGMRKSDYWILDAMAVDKARMRNRLTMDLWLEMARDPWYKSQEKKLVNGYRGRMVLAYRDTLVVTDSTVYRDTFPLGVYHLMERIDRKQLKLPKYVDSLGVQSTLYKSIRAERMGFEKRPSSYCPSPSVKLWDYQWEPKHPDYEDGEPIDWHPLYNMFRFIWVADSATFADGIESYVDLPVWMDYELLCQFVMAWDNQSKNIYMSFYDTQNHPVGLVTPWDLDHSWGRKWDGTEEVPDSLLFCKNQLSIRLRRDYPHYIDSVEARWAGLRATTFNLSYIDGLIDEYFDLYQANGVDTLEQQLWSGRQEFYGRIDLDFEYEREYIKYWMRDHVAFLDEYYHYSNDQVSTSVTKQGDTGKPVRKVVRDGKLYIVKNNEYYDLYGIPCR